MKIGWLRLYFNLSSALFHSRYFMRKTSPVYPGQLEIIVLSANFSPITNEYDSISQNQTQHLCSMNGAIFLDHSK